MRDRHVF